MEGEAPAGDVEFHSGGPCDVPDVGLPKAGDEAAFGLEGPVLATEVGAEDVDVARAFVAGDRLGVLRLARGVARLGAQPFYLPTLLVRGAATVTDGGDTVFDLTLIQARPEPEVPTMLPEQHFVPDRQEPRRLVRVQVEFHLEKIVFTGHAPPP